MSKAGAVVATDRDREALTVLRRLTEAKGWPPSIREFGTALGLSSPSTAQTRLLRLVALGWVVRDPASPRAVRIVDMKGGGRESNGTGTDG